MEVDASDGREFARLMAPLFEETPAFIGRLGAGRPYASWESLFDTAVGMALDMPLREQIELIDAHPRIGAPPGSVSALSFVEQGYGEEEASAEAEAEPTRIQAELERLNREYEARFGFRYVVFVAGRSRSAIVPLMEAALEHDVDEERERALRDVVAIARDRALKTGLMAQDSQPQDEPTQHRSREVRT